MKTKKIYEVVFDTKDDCAHVEFASSRTAAELLVTHENKLHLISQGACGNSCKHGRYKVNEHNVHTVATAKECIEKEVIPELACYQVKIRPADFATSSDKIHVAKITSINVNAFNHIKNHVFEFDDGSATMYISIVVSASLFENLEDYFGCVRKLHLRIKKKIEAQFGDKYNIVHFI